MTREPEAAIAFPNVAAFDVSLEASVVSAAQLPPLFRNTYTEPLRRVKTIGPKPRTPVEMYARPPETTIVAPKASPGCRSGAFNEPVSRQLPLPSRVKTTTSPLSESAFVCPTSSVFPSTAIAEPNPSALLAFARVILLAGRPQAPVGVARKTYTAPGP